MIFEVLHKYVKWAGKVESVDRIQVLAESVAFTFTLMPLRKI